MNKTGIGIALLALGAACALGDIQHFNTGIFGENSTSPVNMLKEAPESAIAPFSILLDVKAGVYYAATVNYPTTLSLEEMRTELNKLYKRYEMPSFAQDETMGIWRNDEAGFSIQLTEHAEAIQVIYIAFQHVSMDDIYRGIDKASQRILNACESEDGNPQQEVERDGERRSAP